MRVIILQDIPKVGKKNEVKDMSAGYARNFLFPRGLAKPATDKTLKALNYQKTREEKEESEELEKYKVWTKKLENIILYFKIKIGQGDKKTGGLFAGSLLNEASKASVIRKRSPGFTEGGNRAFGSVTPLKIKEALKKQGIEVEKDWVLLEKPIKTTGEHKVKIKMPHGLIREVRVVVEAE